MWHGPDAPVARITERPAFWSDCDGLKLQGFFHSPARCWIIQEMSFALIDAAILRVLFNSSGDKEAECLEVKQLSRRWGIER